MLVATRNIRGFNRPLKQKSVCTLVHNHKIDVFGILKSKLYKKALSSLMKIDFPDMLAIHNFDLSDKGRILVIWNPKTVGLNILEMSDQHIHVNITCSLSMKSFFILSSMVLIRLFKEGLFWII